MCFTVNIHVIGNDNVNIRPNKKWLDAHCIRARQLINHIKIVARPFIYLAICVCAQTVMHWVQE